MTLLTVILTHLPAPAVTAQLAYLDALCPGGHFAVCHGGQREDYEGLRDERAVYVSDPTLRGPHFDKSLTQTLRLLAERWVVADPEIDLVWVIEYDHLILAPDFEQALRSMIEGSPGGLFAKWGSPRNDSNWSHHLRLRHDHSLMGWIKSASVREDPSIRFGCLGTGLLFRREALMAFCEASPPDGYVELLVPTVVHHLGYDVVDVDTLGDLHRWVRWLPVFDLDAVLAAERAGACFVHPFKESGSLATIGRAIGAGVNSSVAASRP